MSGVALGVGRGSKMVSNSADWLLRDEFVTDLAAGSVNGTAAEPGPGTRIVNDVENKISISGGKLQLANQAIPSWGEQYLRYAGMSRQAGKMLFGHNYAPNANNALFGWSNSTTPHGAGMGNFEHGFYLAENAPYFTYGTNFARCAILRQTGAFYFVKGGALTVWTLQFFESNGTSVTLYPAVSVYNTPSGNITVDYMRIPDTLWLPVPLASDGFGSAFGTTDGLGHAEGVTGGIGAGGAGVTMSNTGGTWSISGGKAINTPSVGAELVTNGNMEAGDPPTSWSASNVTPDGVADERIGGSGIQSLKITATATGEPYIAQEGFTFSAGSWYRLSAWMRQTTGTTGMKLRARDNHVGGFFIETPKVTSSAWTLVAGTGRCTYTSHAIWGMFTNSASVNDVGYFDDISLKQLTFSDLLSLSNLACSDVFAGAAITRFSTSVQAGLALNWNSPTAPTSGVIVYLGSSIFVDKCVAGVWSNVSATGYTYSAGARLVVAKNGSEYRVYYNNALVGAANTISDAEIVSNTLHGLFSTDASNTLDDLTIYATGTGGEYAELDKWS